MTLGRRYAVYVYAKGYAPAEAKLTAVPEESQEFLDIQLTKNPPLLGRLVDAKDGKPIVGAALLYGIDEKAHYFEWSSFDKYVDGHHSYSFVQHRKSDSVGKFWFAEPSAGPLERSSSGSTDTSG